MIALQLNTILILLRFLEMSISILIFIEMNNVSIAMGVENFIVIPVKRAGCQNGKVMNGSITDEVIYFLAEP